MVLSVGCRRGRLLLEAEEAGGGGDPRQRSRRFQILGGWRNSDRAALDSNHFGGVE